MIPIKILDETAPLEAVVLGISDSLGGLPSLDETYDPKSREHLKAGNYPLEKDLKEEMDQVTSVLEKYNVKVFRPKVIENYNQVFARDIAFVIDHQMVVPHVISFRNREADGIQHVINQVSDVLYPQQDERIEGGDVMPWNGNLFVGYSKSEDFEKYQVARTNEKGLNFLIDHFPSWKIHGFELNKSDTDPKKNALHLDCCFQTVNESKAIVCSAGFKNQEDVEFLVDLFGQENIFEITEKEMYEMNTNFFSINRHVVISDRSFTRLNNQLRTWGIKVEEVKYQEVSKMGGLLRCTTMPLRRSYV